MSIQPRVLFVDDEIYWLNAIRRISRHQKLDWTLEFVESPTLALSMIGQEHWDAVISDYNMPGMNGAEFLEQAAKIKPNLAMIMLSAFDQSYCVEQTNNSQVQFVSKNSSIETVFSALKLSMVNKQLFGPEGLPALKQVLGQLPCVEELDFQISSRDGVPIIEVHCDPIGLHWETTIGQEVRGMKEEVLCKMH